MRWFFNSSRLKVMFVAALGLLSLQAMSALGQSGIKIKGEGTLLDVPGGPSTFNLAGTASHLGLYTCYGEINFVPGTEEGSQDGVGVGAFTAANGDMLVGVVTMLIGSDGNIDIHFSWRDAVEFTDGTVVRSTGRFEDKRPPGLRIACKLVCISGTSICYITCS